MNPSVSLITVGSDAGLEADAIFVAEGLDESTACDDAESSLEASGDPGGSFWSLSVSMVIDNFSEART